MGAIPGPDDDDGGEDVEGDHSAESSQERWGEKPGSFVDVQGIESGIDAEEG